MILKIFQRVIAVLTLIWVMSVPAYGQDSKIVARIGELEITERDLENAGRDIGGQFERLPEDQRKPALLDALIDIIVIAKKAEDEGLSKDANFIERMALLRNRVLHNIYVSETVSKKITDDEVKTLYQKETSKIEEINARHVLVKTKEEALEIVKLLDEGGDFATIAKEKSTGPSGANGGDLGFFGKGQMVPAFEKASFALKVGEHTKKPVKTQFGYHVIKLEKRRTAAPPPFDKVKSQYRQKILRRRYGELIKGARKASKIEILDENLRLPKAGE